MCIDNLSYIPVLSFHKHRSPVVGHPIPSVADIAHPYKIPGVDNQYNPQQTSRASHAAILMVKFGSPENSSNILRSSLRIVKPIFPGPGQGAPPRLNALRLSLPPSIHHDGRVNRVDNWCFWFSLETRYNDWKNTSGRRRRTAAPLPAADSHPITSRRPWSISQPHPRPTGLSAIPGRPFSGWS